MTVEEGHVLNIDGVAGSAGNGTSGGGAGSTANKTIICKSFNGQIWVRNPGKKEMDSNPFYFDEINVKGKNIPMVVEKEPIKPKVSPKRV